jgi:hypothetical protein
VAIVVSRELVEMLLRCERKQMLEIYAVSPVTFILLGINFGTRGPEFSWYEAVSQKTIPAWFGHFTVR